ncbi:hypothetical protein BJ322DRAFT_1053661 [Thelephora terrestris]|uniref:Uncharacterized protein n=1 Tax=Thelephora terrestris TaxID=56493 RepID=A0A9P6HH45_9AGAM|nr:hypothetical protein BJ322DRAFT_1053661 [Thelephora terrestris]
MPRRSRSATPERERRRSRSRSRSRSYSRERSYKIPEGVSEISESDYFLKSDEFRVWLKEEKDRYMDELSSDKSRRYFRKFIKAWNRGKLSKSIYQGATEKAPTTRHRWNFASKTSKKDSDAIRAVREEVEASKVGGSSTNSKRVLGPTLPSRADRVLAEEEVEERRAAEIHRKRKRERAEDKDRVEDMVGPKEIGKAGLLEKKRVKRENDKAFREKGDDGFVEADDRTLMGGGDSFKER